VGGVWGEDVIIDGPELLDHSQAVALSFCEVFTLTRQDIEEVLAEFPEFETMVRKAGRKVLLQRRLLLAMSGGRPVRSFVPRRQARGFTIVQPKMTFEQQMDVIFDERPGVMRSRASANRRSKTRMAEDRHEPVLRDEPTVSFFGQYGEGAGDGAGGEDSVTSLHRVPTGGRTILGRAGEEGSQGGVHTRALRRSAADTAGQPDSPNRSCSAAVCLDSRPHATSQLNHGSPLHSRTGQEPIGLPASAPPDRPPPPGDEDMRLMVQQMMALQKELHSEVQDIGARVSEMSASHIQMAQQLQLLQGQAQSTT
jgi:hypothetical protein